MKESLYLNKKLTELTKRVTILKKRVSILEDENAILKKRLSDNRSWFSRFKDFISGNITIEIIMPWSDKKIKKELSQEEQIDEKIRKVS